MISKMFNVFVILLNKIRLADFCAEDGCFVRIIRPQCGVDLSVTLILDLS